jgi:hypothetical protein
MNSPESGRPEPAKTSALSDLPVDELIVYGRELGLDLRPDMEQGELLRRVRDRQQLLHEIDREALLDVVVWARRPVRRSASKEQLARSIASIYRMDFHGLSDRGLVALGRLRGVEARPDEPRADIEHRLRDQEPLWDRLRRRRRKVMGSLISRLVASPHPDEEDEDYRFLPEDRTAPSLKEQIADEGVVGGIARRLRGVADDYVQQKLDEIELRIDAKLDEIDRRLGEWRDREIANRLKIIKMTLIASILVALLSYGYSCLRSHG